MNPLDPETPTYQLSLWQKRQAAMLYYYSSLDYLKALLPQIEQLIATADMLLERRSILDPLMVSERWGVRDTAANWSTGGFPALVTFREGTMWDIAKRDDQCYGITGANQCARMLREYSMQWATEEQEEHFRARAELVFKYAGKIDGVMEQRWSDVTFWFIWERNKHLFPRLPKFKVHLDIEGETGKVPGRTGVYIPQDDPHGALQFGWTGGGDGFFETLKKCQTFNDIGLDALKAVGRAGLWEDEAGLLKFIQQSPHASAFLPASDDPADYQVQGKSITERPCKWYFVELLEGEFEDSNPHAMADPEPKPQRPARKAGGEMCTHAGWWYSPAGRGAEGRRYFKEGEIFPDFKNDWGSTFWQWDP